MVPPKLTRRVVPVALGIAMLAVIVAAALTPNFGFVRAQSNSQYGGGGAGGFSSLELSIIALLLVLIAVAAIALLVAVRRRRRRGGGGGLGGEGTQLPPWEPGTSVQPAYTPGAPPTQEVPPPQAEPFAPAGAATYYEPPAAPPAVGPSPFAPRGRARATPEWAEQEPASAAGAPAAGAPEAETAAEEPDIDRLMEELDQISDDILKKTPPKKGSSLSGKSDQGSGSA